MDSSTNPPPVKHAEEGIADLSIDNMVLHLLLLTVVLFRVSTGLGIVELEKLFEQHSARYVKDLEDLVGGGLPVTLDHPPLAASCP